MKSHQCITFIYTLIYIFFLSSCGNDKMHNELSNFPELNSVDSISIYNVNAQDPYSGLFRINKNNATAHITDKLKINKIYSYISIGHKQWKNKYIREFNPTTMYVFNNDDRNVMVLWLSDTNIIGILTPPITPKNAIFLFILTDSQLARLKSYLK